MLGVVLGLIACLVHGIESVHVGSTGREPLDPAVDSGSCLVPDIRGHVHAPLLAKIKGPSVVGTGQPVVIDGSESSGIGVPFAHYWMIDNLDPSVQSSLMFVANWLVQLPSNTQTLHIPADFLKPSKTPYRITLTVSDCLNQTSGDTHADLLVQSQDNSVATITGPRFVFEGCAATWSVQGAKSGFEWSVSAVSYCTNKSIQIDLSDIDTTSSTLRLTHEILTMQGAYKLSVSRSTQGDLPEKTEFSFTVLSPDERGCQAEAAVQVPTVKIFASFGKKLVVHPTEAFSLKAGLLFVSGDAQDARFSWGVSPPIQSGNINFGSSQLIVPENSLIPDTLYEFWVDVDVGLQKHKDKVWIVVLPSNVANPRQQSTELGHRVQILSSFHDHAFSPSDSLYLVSFLNGLSETEQASAQFQWKLRVVGAADESLSTFDLIGEIKSFGASTDVLSIPGGQLEFGVNYWFSVDVSFSLEDSAPETQHLSGFITANAGLMSHALSLKVAKIRDGAVSSLPTLFRATVADGGNFNNATFNWVVTENLAFANGTVIDRVLEEVTQYQHSDLLVIPPFALTSGGHVTVKATLDLGASKLSGSTEFEVAAILGAGELEMLEGTQNTWQLIAKNIAKDASLSPLSYSFWIVPRDNTTSPLPLVIDSELPGVTLNLLPFSAARLAVDVRDLGHQRIRVEQTFNMASFRAHPYAPSSCRELFNCDLGDFNVCDEVSIDQAIGPCYGGNTQDCLVGITLGAVHLVNTYDSWSSCTSKLNPKALELLNKRYLNRAQRLLAPLRSLSLTKQQVIHVWHVLAYLVTQQSPLPPFPTFPESSIAPSFALATTFVEIVQRTLKAVAQLRACLPSTETQLVVDTLSAVTEFTNAMCKISTYYDQRSTSSITSRDGQLQNVAHVTFNARALQPETVHLAANLEPALLPAQTDVFQLLKSIKRSAVSVLEQMTCKLECQRSDLHDWDRKRGYAESLELFSPSLMLLGVQGGHDTAGITVAHKASSLLSDVIPAFHLASEAVPSELKEEDNYLVFAVTHYQLCSTTCDNVASPVVHIELRSYNTAIVPHEAMNPPIMLTLPINDAHTGHLGCGVTWEETWSKQGVQTYGGSQTDEDSSKMTCLLSSIPGDFVILDQCPILTPYTALQPKVPSSPSASWSPVPPESHSAQPSATTIIMPEQPTSSPSSSLSAAPSPLQQSQPQVQQQQGQSALQPIVESTSIASQTPEPSKSAHPSPSHSATETPSATLRPPVKRAHAFIEHEETQDSKTIDVFKVGSNPFVDMTTKNMEWLAVITTGSVIGVVLGIGLMFVIVHHNHTVTKKRKIISSEGSVTSGSVSGSEPNVVKYSLDSGDNTSRLDGIDEE
eukprot:c21272_g1_i1.p1 GENE.c21272_g1_i1~~c21272_g1_i1.p1  ORF type:complete len:1358 (+),score=237.85 c21272_g1_i1:32-4105(+)